MDLEIDINYCHIGTYYSFEMLTLERESSMRFKLREFCFIHMDKNAVERWNNSFR